MGFSITETHTDSDTDSRQRLKLFTIDKGLETEGNFLDEPVINLFARDSSGKKYGPIVVEGFYPFFYITEKEFLDTKKDVLNETMVRTVTVREDILSDNEAMNGAVNPTKSAPRQRLDGTDLVKIETVKPDDVKKLSSFFEWHGEADVSYTNQFLIESEIKRGFSIPEGRDRVSFDEIEVLEESDTPSVEARMHTVDIEVWSGGSFPDTMNPQKPITAISAHDSYNDEYFVGVLHPDSVTQGSDNSWDTPDFSYDNYPSVDVKVYHDENQLIADYFHFIERTDPDIMSGWNSSNNDIGSGFDYPYLVNRAKSMNEWSYRDISYEGGQSYVTSRGSAYINGREMFDMLQGYKKTQIHEKRSYSLGFIAEEELGYGKEDVADLDEGWLHEPEQFIKYNIRDTEAVVEIEKSQQVLELYDNIRSVAGCTYGDALASNIGIIDVLFLRQAKSKGLALPTSMKPERGWYYGAKVFNPLPGKHRNAVYPDLASLYPYLMWSLNISPETLYESLEEAKADGYSRDDMYSAYIDYRDDSEKRNSDPETSEIFYLKPEVKTGFVRDVVDDMVEMKYEYKGMGKKYSAVKRITNSIYGVFGDSNTFRVGFRLFDWRLAETITIAGRKVLNHTADTFVDNLQQMGYKQAELIGGDTDSVVTKIPTASGRDETLEASFTAAEAVNKSYDELMADQFNIQDPTNHKMEVEIESYADAIFFLRDFDSDDPTDGIKKKYSQLIEWDEGETIENPDPETKGFKLVRSDAAEATQVVQKGVLHRILREDNPRDSVRSFLKSEYSDAVNGEISPDYIGIPSSISSDPMDYGWSKRRHNKRKKGKITDIDGNEIPDGDEYVTFYTPQPHIKGARYATAYIDGEDIQSGAKPLMFYTENVSPQSELPEVYNYGDMFELTAPSDLPYANERKMVELETEVDAIALEDSRNMPDGIEIDYDKMAEKTIEDAVDNIVRTMGWTFDELVSESDQSDLSSFM